MKHLISILLVFVYAFSLAGNIPTASQPTPAQAQELSANISDAWWASAQASILESEYQLSLLRSEGDIYQAPNRAQNLRVSFGPDKVWVTPRLNASEWMWGLQLQAYGYAGALHPVSAATRLTNANQIAYQRGNLSEWYINREDGIEQGFTLFEPHASQGETTLVVLELAIEGNLKPQMAQHSSKIDFLTPAGETALQYGKLFAYDHNGTALPTQMTLQDGKIQLIVDTAQAVYPITVDPLVTSASWSYESNQANVQLGISVASAGDVNGDGFDDVIVGAHQYDHNYTNEGSVDVFYGSNTGLHTSPDWSADGGQINANLGISVASAGDVNGDGYGDIIVGSYYYTNGNSNEGGAFVWYGSASGLNCGSGCPVTAGSADWSAEGNLNNAYFGQSVASAGDVNGDGYADVIIGAYNYANGNAVEGAAYVWYGSSSGLAANGTPANADWSVEGNQDNASLGFAVATAGDVNGDGYGDIIIGASGYSTTLFEGAAFVWYGSAFGLACGASCPVVPTSANWRVQANQYGASLGRAVGSAGDVNGDGYADILVGAPGMDDGNLDEGVAYLWYGSASGLACGAGCPVLPSSADWNAQVNQNTAYMGFTTLSAGDVNGDGYADVLISAPPYDDGSVDEGAAFVWFGSGSGLGANGLPSNADWSVQGNLANAQLGYSAASAGDVNGDGYSDVLTGSPGYSNGETSEGQALAFYGGSYGITGDLSQAAWRFESPIEDGLFGSVSASAGDVNGDGYSDIIIGAARYDYNGRNAAGAVFVFYGSANGLPNTANDPNNADWRLYGNQIGDAIFGNVGSIVGSAGDLNGDGYGDIFIGAYYQDGTVTDEGMVFVWYGSSTGLPCGSPCRVENPASAPWSAHSGQANSQFGIHANTAGDVNGDGFSDLIIGARNYDVSALADAGAAYVWYGSPNGLSCATSCPVLPTTANWQILGDQAGAQLGNEVSSAGDVNGDGYSDILVGAPAYDEGQADEGKVYAWYGSAQGLVPGNANWSAQGNLAGAYFGYTVAKAGNVNGDGFDDVYIGARYYTHPETNEGGAFIWHGSANGINGGVNGAPSDNINDPAIEDWRAEINQANAQFSYANSGYAGDVNGDGYDDIIIGAWRWSNPDPAQLYEGAVFMWLGSPNGVNNSVNGTPINTAWQMESNLSDGRLGIAATTAGDVNGDGYGDIIVGAYNFSGGHALAGAVYAYYGNASDGAPILPTLRRATNNTQILPGSSADSFSSVRLNAWLRSPLGRSNVRLQWEIKPFNTAFNGSGLGQSAWVDSTTAGTTINELVTSLSGDTRYHWRVRLQAQPLQANDSDWVIYQGPWFEGGQFLTSIHGIQNITGTGTVSLLGSSASVNIVQQGTLSSLTIHSYPNTAHSQENANGGGVTMLDRYFSITPNAGASDYNVTMCLNYNDTEIPAHYDESQLNLCRWTGSAWACSATSRDAVNNLICAANVTAFSDWTIGANGPTAIELSDLRAYPATPQWVAVFLMGLSLLAAAGGLLWLLNRKKNA